MKRRRLWLVPLWGLLLAGGIAGATPTVGEKATAKPAPKKTKPSPWLGPRDTARVSPKGQMTVGIFAPLTWSVGRRVELQFRPLLLISSPGLQIKVEHLRRRLDLGSVHLAATYGLYFPSPALHLDLPLGLRSYFTPSCKVIAADPERVDHCQKPGWFLQPTLGVLFSYATLGDKHVVTARFDAAVGVKLAGERTGSLDTLPFLDLYLAPVFNTFRLRLGLRYDLSLLRWLRFSAEADVYLVGASSLPTRNPWTFKAYLGLDFDLGRRTRMILGLWYWNSDQRREVIKVDDSGFGRWVRVRNHDFLPQLDFIWHWGV